MLSSVVLLLPTLSRSVGAAAHLGKEEREGPGLTESLRKESSKQLGFREFSQVYGVGRVFFGSEQSPSGFHLWALLELAGSKLLHGVVPEPIHTHQTEAQS